MILSTPFAERVRKAFEPTPRGVVGLVDDLLGLCRIHQLRIKFQDGHCHIRRLGTDSQDSLDVPVPKSVFRAVLARVAALCNERQPDSVTPYGGESEVIVQLSQGDGPPSTCYVSFTNTPSDQRLEVRFSRWSVPEGTQFTVLFRDKRTVSVFGQSLKYIPTSSPSTGHGLYKIVSRSGGKPVVVALFACSEVIGVFSGDIRESDGATALAEPDAVADRPRESGSADG